MFTSFTLTIDIVLDKEAKLYSMLPLFCKIFNSVPPSVITEKFVEAVQFTQVTSNSVINDFLSKDVDQNLSNVLTYFSIKTCQA